MASIADKNYAGLAASINDWTERSDADDVIASYISLATADLNLRVRDRRQETTVTLTVSNGSVALPSDFLEPLSVSHATYGDIEQTTRRGVTNYNPLNSNAIPAHYAVEGSTFFVDASIDGDFSFLYRAKIPDIDAVTTTTNWLLTLAPQAYLFMGIAALHTRYENFPSAQAFKGAAQEALDLAGVQSLVAQRANAPLAMRGVRP
jgi:hypothetical protein